MDRRPTTSRETTVLICDDDSSMRSLLHVVVDLAPGMRTVGEAADGEVAIREASRLQPDVILLDLAMPVLSGLDALPQLRQCAAAAKIIVLAGFSTASVADQVHALGAASYLEKGADPDAIVATIERVVAGATTSVQTGQRLD
jgi:DNA-binding NarL/FixJ family response regulator